MDGLERIIKRIGENAEQTAASVISDAEKKAASLIAEAEEAGDAEARSIVRNAKNTCETMIRRTHSSGELMKKRTLLSCRVEIIDNVIARAVRNFLYDEPEVYFSSMVKLVKRYAISGYQTMIFSDKDLERLPTGFEKCVNEEICDRGSVKICGGGSFEGGFLLIGEDVVENCTIAALIGEVETEIRDELQRLLFTE